VKVSGLLIRSTRKLKASVVMVSGARVRGFCGHYTNFLTVLQQRTRCSRSFG
jgi:hypothetical protein